MQNVTHVLTNEQSELRADTAEASRRRLTARANIGLDQVDNTSDADKPISSATQDALDSKMDVDNGTYLKSAEVSGNGYTLTIRPNNGDVIEFQGGGIVETVQADWAENSPSDPSFIKNKPDLSGFATTSAMDTALGQKQDTIDDLNTIRSGAAAGATAVQPGSLATVATTGSYNNLTDKPTIPTKTSDITNDSGFITSNDIPQQVQADWNSSSGVSEILNKPDLSVYATTSNMETALAGKQATIDDLETIRSGAAAGATAVQPSVLDDYATTSDLTSALADKQDTINDLSTIREGASAGATAVQPADLNAYATTSDVSAAVAGKQDTINDLSDIRTGAGLGATAVQPSTLNDAISSIRQVPISESTDLNKVLTVNGSGTPVWAPAQGGGGGGASVNDVTVNGTSVVNSNGVGEVIVPTTTSALTNDSGFVTASDIPTSTSDLTNDSGFITSSDLPVTDVTVGSTSVVNNQGVAEIPDLSGFVTTSAMNTALASKQDTINDLSDIRTGAGLGATAVQPEDLATVATTGNYSDLNGAPSIPSKTSNLTNDSGFITSSDIPSQVQADWTESDNTKASFVKNKPSNIVQDANYVHTDNNYDNAAVSKLSGIESGAQVNVQSDWNASSGDSAILNKPDLSIYATTSAMNTALGNKQDTIGDLSDIRDGATAGASSIQGVTVNGSSVVSNHVAAITVPTKTSDLTNDSGFITTVPAQVQSDWTETDDSDPSFIAHKPSIPSDTNDLTNGAGFITSSDIPVTDVKVGNVSVVNNQGVAEISAQVNADWNSSSGLSEILHKPSIPSKTSDLTNDSNFITASDIPAQVQSDWTETDNTKASFVKNKPSLATVATSGSYVDLSNTPTLASVATSGDYGDLSNTPSLSAVATSGDYDDLTNKPTIPSVPVTDVTVDGTSVLSNGTAAVILPVKDVTVGGSSVVTNQGVAEITIPAQSQADWTEADNTKPSFVKNKPTLASVATSGDYGDLSNTPTIPAAQVNSDWDAVSGVAQILNKPSLATVATTGSYNDLSNKPTIPTVPVTDVTVNGSSVVSNGTAVVVVPAQEQADWNESDNTKPSFVKNKPTIPSVPVTDVTVDGTSVLSNGTAAVVIPVKDVTVDGSSVVTNQGIAAITIPSQVQADWAESDNTKASYVKNKPANLVQDANYVHTDNNFTTSLKDKLDGIATGAEVNVQADWNQTDSNADDYIKNRPTIPAAQVNSDWDASSGVAQILNKPSIPTNTSDLNNDSGFITVSDIPAQVQTDWTETDNTKASFVKNKPSLATVATSGSYTDLSNKPTIPSVPVQNVTVNGTSVVSNGTAAVVVPAQVQADWTESDNTKASFVKNKPTLATVATSGSYGDLSNAPTLASVATSGDYDDLTNKPTIPAAQVNSDWDAVSGVAQILNKPSLSTVATTGSYDDLIDKPTIPTVPVTDVTVNGSSVVSNGTAAVVVPEQAQADWTETDNTKASFVKNKPSLATVATTGSYTDLSNTPTIPSVPVTDVTVDGTSVLSNGTAAVVIPVKDVTVGGSSVVTNQGVAAITIPTQVQADWTESDNSDPSFIANKPDLTVKADKVTSATSGDFASLDSNGNLTDSGVSANSFKTVQNAVNDPTSSGTATSFIDSISQNSNGVITATKKTIPTDLVSRTVYVGQDCVYNDKEFWGNASTVADVINDYANQTVTDYRGNSVSLVRFQAEYDSNRYRIATIDETPGTVEYNRKIGGQIIDLMRSDFWMSSHPTYDIIKFDKDMDTLFDLLMTGSPMNAYLLLYNMTSTAFITDARRDMYMDMIKAYDAWPYADKDTAYADFMDEHSLDRFVQVSTTWPLNSWNSYRYVMAGTKTATDKVIFVIRHAERGDDTSVNGDINSTGVTTCTTMGEQARNNASWTSNNVTYTIDNFPANDATYYSTEYLRCKHSAQAFASARYDTDFDASDYSEITVEADMLNQYRFFYQPASSGNSTLIRNYSVDPTRLSSSELSDYFGVSTAAEAQEKLSNDYVRVCKEILNKSTARLNMFYTHDFFTLPLAVMASNKYFDFSGNSSADNRNWINYCAGIGMILHPDNTYEVLPVRGKSNGTMTI